MRIRMICVAVLSLVVLALLAAFAGQFGTLLGTIGNAIIFVISLAWIAFAVWCGFDGALDSKLRCVSFLLFGSFAILVVSLAIGVLVDTKLLGALQGFQRGVAGISITYVLAFASTVLMYYLIATKADLEVASFSFITVSCIATAVLFLFALICQFTPQTVFVNLVAAGNNVPVESIEAELEQYDIRGLLTCLAQAMYAPVWLALIVGEEKIRRLEKCGSS